MIINKISKVLIYIFPQYMAAKEGEHAAACKGDNVMDEDLHEADSDKVEEEPDKGVEALAWRVQCWLRYGRRGRWRTRVGGGPTGGCRVGRGRKRSGRAVCRHVSTSRGAMTVLASWVWDQRRWIGSIGLLRQPIHYQKNVNELRFLTKRWRLKPSTIQVLLNIDIE